MQTEITLGIDLGGTKVAIGLVDPSGNIIHYEKITTQKNKPDAVVTDIVSIVKKMSQRQPPIINAGVGMAGQIESTSGLVHFAPNLQWKEYPLGEILSEQLNIPVKVLNDVRAATWGEWLHGAGQKCNDLVCLFVGTGIGSGIVSGGRMVNGSDNAAGEVGHMVLDFHGSLCSCGNRGCFETLAAGWGIAQRAKEAVVRDPAGGKGLLQLTQGNIDEITARSVFDAYRLGVPIAVKVIEEATEALIAGISNLVNIVNPARVILGGGVIEGRKELINLIRQGVSKRALKVATQHLEIVPAALGDNGGVIGAAAFARQERRKNEKI